MVVPHLWIQWIENYVVFTTEKNSHIHGLAQFKSMLKIQLSVCICMCVCVCVCVYIYMCVYIYIYTLIQSHTMKRYSSKERKEALPYCHNIDGPQKHYAKWNKSNRKRWIPHDLICTWNLANKTRTKFIYTENRLVVSGVEDGQNGWPGSKDTDFQL